jgi:hypothetical protein
MRFSVAPKGQLSIAQGITLGEESYRIHRPEHFD